MLVSCEKTMLKANPVTKENIVFFQIPPIFSAGCSVPKQNPHETNGNLAGVQRWATRHAQGVLKLIILNAPQKDPE